MRFIPPVSFGERAVRVGLVMTLLSVSVLGLVWIGGSEWFRFSGAEPAAAPERAELPEPSVARKGDRLPINGIAAIAAREQSPAPPPAATATAPDPTPKSNQHSARPRESGDPGPQSKAPAALDSRLRGNERSRLTPVPETRPATIPGWTVRDIVGGTAVLEGPQGVWNAAQGDSVPGLGKVESIVRWGNRLIVTTERGLVSTR